MTWNSAKNCASSLFARGIPLIVGALVFSFLVGCDECRSSSECGPGEYCSSGECRPAVDPFGSDDPTDTGSGVDSSLIDTSTEDTEGTDTGTETVTETDTGTGENTDTGTNDQDTGTTICDDALTDCPVHETVCGHYECNLAKECVLVTDKAYNDPCEDSGLECVKNVCRDGVCEAVPVNSGDPCSDDGNPCTVDVCDDGQCGQAAAGQFCADDGNPCTNNICDQAGNCVAFPAADGASCDDGLWCSGRDVCMGGACTSQDAPCATADLCTTKTCSEPLPGELAGVCGVIDVIPSGGPCDNGFYCDGSADSCQSGLCIPSGYPCSGSTTCNDVRCDETADECSDSPAPEHSPCLDANLCNGPEECLAGACEAGIGPCEEQSDCASRSCDDSTGFAECGDQISQPDGTLCVSDDSCSGLGARLCVAGECAYAADPACGSYDADSNFCTRMWPCSPSAIPGEPECKELPIAPSGFRADLVLGCTAGSSDTDPDYVWDTIADFSTVSTNNEVSTYSGCAGEFTGGEAVVEIEAPTGVSYTITASFAASSGKGEMRMLLITNPCDPDGTCQDMQEKSLTATKSAGRQLIVVDGLNGSRGRGQLSIACD